MVHFDISMTFLVYSYNISNTIRSRAPDVDFVYDAEFF